MKHESLKHLLGVLSFIILVICLVQVINHNLGFKEYTMFYAITFFSGFLVVIECIDLYKFYNKKKNNAPLHSK